MDNILHLKSVVEAYDHPRRYLEDELIVLDVMLEFEIERMQAKQQLLADPPGPYRGMYFSEHEARLLLSDEVSYIQLDKDQILLLEQLRQRILAKIERSDQEGIVLPIHYLRKMNLADVEIRA